MNNSIHFFVTSLYKLSRVNSFFCTQMTQMKQIFTDLCKLPRFCFAKSCRMEIYLYKLPRRLTATPLQKFEGDYFSQHP